MSYEIEKQTITVREPGKGRTWKAASYSKYDNDFSCYLNGGGAFTLERNGGVWIVTNDAPHSSQYRTRKQYLRALAQATHEAPEIGQFPVTEFPTLDKAFIHAIGIFKDKGWRTRDSFSDSLAMTKMKKALAA